MSEPGNELEELLWDNGPALRRTASPFPPFSCSAAGSTKAQELAKHPASATGMAQGHDDDAVPWLQHYPIIGVDDDDGGADTAPLPQEYFSTLFPGFSDLPAAVASRDAGAPSTSHAAVAVPPLPEPPAPPKQQQQQPSPPRSTGEGVMNFSFFSRPLQRSLPQASVRTSAAGSKSVESTLLQTNRLRSTPLFSEQRTAWLQPPKESAATASASRPPAPPVPVRHAAEPAAALPQRMLPEARATAIPQRLQPEVRAAALPQRLQPEVRAAALPQRLQSEARGSEMPPPPATATTSSVCSDNGERSQLKRSSHQTLEWSISQDDEDLDDEAGGLRRSAARSTKRGRTAEVHTRPTTSSPSAELKRSSVADETSGKSKLSEVRTSSGTFISKGKDPIVAGIEDKIAAWTFLPKENGEDMQVLRYKRGEKYEPHYDFFTDSVNTIRGGHRVATVLLYLTDVAEGGETVFPLAKAHKGSHHKDLSECAQKGIAVKPRKGDALLFFNLRPDAATDPSSLHGGCEVIKGEKWSATKWIHVASFDKVYHTPGNCTDNNNSCSQWAALGECVKNPAYMVGTAALPGHCRRSCNVC